MSVRITIGDITETLGGVGYHDHNWGDMAMHKLINHWYWGRAQAGAYSIVASYITAEHKYGDAEVPVFLLGRGTARSSPTTPTTSRSSWGSGTPTSAAAIPSPMSSSTSTAALDDLYRVSFRRRETITDRQLIDEISGAKRLLARLAHFDGSYLRFTGDVQLEHFVNGVKVEDVRDPGIWELMYFGHAR